jgi:hypothetical protein
MIEVEFKFDMVIVSVILTSLFLMSFTFLGIVLNGQKVWREHNNMILYTELVIFSGSFLYILYDIF